MGGDGGDGDGDGGQAMAGQAMVVTGREAATTASISTHIVSQTGDSLLQRVSTELNECSGAGVTVREGPHQEASPSEWQSGVGSEERHQT